MKIPTHKYLELLPDLGEERTQKFTSIVLTLIALSLFGLFAINPTLSTIAKINKEITDSQDLSQKLEKKIADLASLQQAYKRLELENDIESIFASLPTSSFVPLLIGQIQSLARDANIRVTQIQNSEVDLFKEEAPKEFYSFSFSLSAEGAYENLLKFMENITSMQRAVSVSKISIGKEGTSSTLKFNMEGVAYYKK